MRTTIEDDKQQSVTESENQRYEPAADELVQRGKRRS